MSHGTITYPINGREQEPSGGKGGKKESQEPHTGKSKGEERDLALEHLQPGITVMMPISHSMRDKYVYVTLYTEDHVKWFLESCCGVHYEQGKKTRYTIPEGYKFKVN